MKNNFSRNSGIKLVIDSFERDGDDDISNRWLVFVAQTWDNHPDFAGKRDDILTVLSWHKTRASARKYARNIQKAMKCPIRESR